MGIAEILVAFGALALIVGAIALPVLAHRLSRKGSPRDEDRRDGPAA